MSREIKRVPLSFDWPLQKVWRGYVNPYLDMCNDCAACEGSGYSPDAKALKDKWYGYVDFQPSETGSTEFTWQTPEVKALAERNIRQNPEYYGHGDVAVKREAKRLADHFNRRWSHHLDQDDVDALFAKKRIHGCKQSPKASELNAAYLQGFGHDAINAWICIRSKCKRMGLTVPCAACNGTGSQWESQHAKFLAENWTPDAVPEGDGWQLWETVSDGKPVSPVFETEQEFKTYLIGEGYSESAAAGFIKQGWCPSGSSDGNGMRTNIETCGV